MLNTATHIIIENKSFKALIGNSTFINYMVDMLFRSSLQLCFKLKHSLRFLHFYTMTVGSWEYWLGYIFSK